MVDTCAGTFTVTKASMMLPMYQRLGVFETDDVCFYSC